MLKGKIQRWEIVEAKLNVSMIKAALSKGELDGEIDWSKAAKA